MLIDASKGEQFNLGKLRVVTSTGSALAEDMYRWFYATAFPPRYISCR